MIKIDEKANSSWMPELPKSWSVKKTKYLFDLHTDPAPANNNMELLSVYTDLGVRPRRELEERGNKASTTDGYWIVKKNDIVVNKLLAWMGAIGYSAYEGVTSPAYDVLRPKEGVSSLFYSHLFRTKLFSNEMKRHSRGIMEMRLRLYFSEFGNIPLPVPPKEEIDKILKYISNETQSIDHLIEKQQQLIKLLKEKKIAKISLLLGKGLNPNIDFKKTSSEQVDSVPIHWKEKRLKDIVILNRETISENSDLENFDYIDIGGVSLEEGIIETEVFPDVKSAPSRARRVVRQGDVIISTVRTYLKAIAAITDNYDGFIASTGFAVATPRENVRQDFLSYLLRSKYFVDQTIKRSKGVSYPSINTEELSAIKIFLPSKDEQEEIAEHLLEIDRSYDSLIRKAKGMIQLLSEKRMSLVTRAVTGQVKFN